MKPWKMHRASEAGEEETVECCGKIEQGLWAVVGDDGAGVKKGGGSSGRSEQQLCGFLLIVLFYIIPSVLHYR